jgi:hypothetical protein
MKTKVAIWVLLMVLITSLITVMGQEKQDKSKQSQDSLKKKEQIKIYYDARKDAVVDLQKAMEESLKAQEKALQEKKKNGYIDDQQFLREAQALKDYQKKLEERQSRIDEFDNQGTWVMPDLPEYNFKYFPRNDALRSFGIYSGNRENNSMNISKSLEDVTYSTDFSYDVKEGSNMVSFSVNGAVKSGELKISLKKPGKTTFQEFTISPLADVNWSQQFRWDDDEAEGYTGKWIISLSAVKATGNYRIQVNSR